MRVQSNLAESFSEFFSSMSDLSQFVIPRGFRFGAAKAGLKQSGRIDFALIVAGRSRIRRRGLHRQSRKGGAAAGGCRASSRNGRARCRLSRSMQETPTARSVRLELMPRAPHATLPLQRSAASRKRSSRRPPESSVFRCPPRSSSQCCPACPHPSAPSPITSSRSPRPSSPPTRWRKPPLPVSRYRHPSSTGPVKSARKFASPRYARAPA